MYITLLLLTRVNGDKARGDKEIRRHGNRAIPIAIGTTKTSDFRLPTSDQNRRITKIQIELLHYHFANHLLISDSDFNKLEAFNFRCPG